MIKKANTFSPFVADKVVISLQLTESPKALSMNRSERGQCVASRI